MNLKNLLTLTIRTFDFNLVARQPNLIAKLRSLTLGPYSGLNHELTRMLKDVQKRKVNCKIILAYRFKKLIGWSILSKENTNFFFSNDEYDGFNGANGWMFQVFIDPAHRRVGVGSKIYKTALKITKKELVHICPWDDASYHFFDKFPNVNRKLLQ